jgi:hypothetical protein
MRDVEGRGQGAGKSGQMAQIKAHIKQVMTGRDYNKAASNGLLAATDGVAERLRREGDTGEIGRLERREGGGKPEASDVEKSERGFPSVQQRWAQCRPGINPYLRDERGIREDVLRTFQHGIRNEPEGETRFLVGFCAVKKDADGKDVTTPSGYKVRVQENARGFCAAHTTEGGEVVGFERKGPRANPEDKRAFSKFSVLDHTRGERKGITRLTNVPKDAPINRVYAGESVVDLLSIYQHDGQPSGVVLSSTYGQTTDAAFAELGKLASRHPGAEIHLAFDSDGKGAEFARKASEAITKFNPEAHIVSRQPPAAFKDWNDALLLKTRSELSPEDAAKAKADMRAEALVNEAQGIDTKRLQLWTAAKEGDLTPDEHDTEIGKLNRRMADLTRAEAAYRIEFGHSALEHAARTAAKPSEGLHVKAALQTPPAAQKSSFVRSGSFQGGQEPRVPGGHSISQ